MDSLDEKHKLAIGDKLSFRILEDLEDPKEPLDPKALFVTDSGDIEIPYIGRVPAENKSCKELAREIKAELEKDYYYKATVILAVDVMAKTRGRVYLVGPVRVPGPQEIPSDEVLTLSKAIMRAGGFTDYADRHDVKVTRKPAPGDTEKKTFVVDVAKIFDEGKVERDLPLEPGDLIFIPERLIRF
jgi:protein involved in polysaccharide export with SLBB domain